MPAPQAPVTIHSVRDWFRLFSVSFLFVVLIIFIFFMLVLPIRPDVPAFVDVPTARAASKSPELEHDLTISVRANGMIYLEGTEVHVTALTRRLSAARRQGTDTPTVRIRADRAALFRNVRRVVIAARNAGFTRATFMVRQESVTVYEGFSLRVTAPEEPNPWPAAVIAAASLAGAVLFRFFRNSQSVKPGCAGWFLLLLAALALLFIWSLYYPSCPPGMWC
jgi:biopolymer transport protein ExbD